MVFKKSCSGYVTFQSLSYENLTEETFIYDTDPLLAFSQKLIERANKTIPKTSTNPKRTHKPWFDNECKEAIKDRKKKESKYWKYY